MSEARHAHFTALSCRPFDNLLNSCDGAHDEGVRCNKVDGLSPIAKLVVGNAFHREIAVEGKLDVWGGFGRN